MSGKPENLSQALDDMKKESASGKAHLDDLKQRLESELHRIEETLNSLKPDFEDLKERASAQAQKAKNKVEEEVHKNVWATLGIVGLVFFVIGFLIGNRRRD